MDNFQFWLYVIIAVIYVISRAMKKRNQQRRAEAPPAPQQDPPLPPLSFEELLREITEGKKPQPAPQPKQIRTPTPPRPKPEFAGYDDEIEPEGKSLERVDYDIERQEASRQVYERAQREASLKSSLEALQSDISGRKSSLQTLQSSLGSTESIRFESFRMGDKHNLVAEYLKELRTPAGMKKAVVLSEILKPKF